MKKNNKICVFLVVLFSVLFLLCTCSFASTDTLNFNGFDGNTYNITNIPEEFNNYKHFVVVKDPYNCFYIACFNESLEIIRDSSFITLIPHVDTDTRLLYCSSSNWTVSTIGDSHSFLNGSTFIYSCSDLLQYSDRMNSEEGFFYNPPIVAQGTLAPIYQETPLEEVMKEILEILPVVLMTIVGLIGLRKALALLSMVLHRS